MNVEAKLAQMGLTLPHPNPPAGNYIGAVQTGNLPLVSGHVPRRQGQVMTNR